MATSPIQKTSGVQSTLVIHQGALGDFILALPALKTLRMSFPQAKPVILGYPRILELVEKRFYAEETLSIDRRGMTPLFNQGGSLDVGLSQFFKGFDLVVVFGRDGGGTLVSNLRRVCQGQILSIHSFPPWEERVHLTDYLLTQLAQYGFSISEPYPKLHLKESDREWARDFWKSMGVTPEERAKVIVLHPGSGSKKKVWPLDRFLSLAHRLQDHLGSKFLIVFGPAEGKETQKIFEGMDPTTFILAKGLTLLQLASVMEGCWFFIGNDSGISHLAAAMGLSTLVIFGPTDEKVWSPRGEKTAVVRRGVPCSPCPPERFFHCTEFECLNGIQMEEVLRGLEPLGVHIQS
ncbi:MAG: glycosyltransferase family 9 protein [Syntrophaceae bacterium]|nr:glycosyltransferase family 9 protein [Syntrophaceae bacterium]